MLMSLSVIAGAATAGPNLVGSGDGTDNDDGSDDEPAPGQVEISNVSLSPDTVDATTTNEHTLTFDVSNVSNDGQGDVFTLTFPNGTLVSSGSISAVDSDGDRVGLEPGTTEGDTTTVTFLPFENPNYATSPDLTVTVEDATVAAPSVTNATDVPIQIDWEDSANGTASASATLTVTVSADNSGSYLDNLAGDDGIQFDEVIQAITDFNTDTPPNPSFSQVLEAISRFNS